MAGKLYGVSVGPGDPELMDARMGEKGEQQRQAGGAAPKRKAALAGIALAAVLVLGSVGYGALSVRSTDAAAASGVAPSAGSANASEERGPSLLDHNATIYTEYGDARTLSQLADGKPFVMNFWATWCPYCVQEMGDYQEICDEYEGRVSFAFIDIADGKRETVQDAAAWLYDHEYALPAYYDTTLEAMYAYGATSLPTTVVVAADGEILDISAGAIDPALMRAALDSLLEV